MKRRRSGSAALASSEGRGGVVPGCLLGVEEREQQQADWAKNETERWRAARDAAVAAAVEEPLMLASEV